MSSTEDESMKNGGMDGTHTHSHHHHDHHGHSHDHQHDHDSDAATSSMTSHLLKYMLDHNTHHVEELQDLITKLNNEGNRESAEAATRALEFYQQGNHELAHAVESLETGERSHEHTH